MSEHTRIEKDRVIEAWEYLAETSEEFASNSGLKPEFQSLCFAGYCCALQHLAYALNLQVELEDFDPDSQHAKRIRHKFPIAKAEGR